MAIPTGPQPISTIQTLRDRSRDLIGQRKGAMIGAVIAFLAGAITIAATWRFVGWEIAVFGLGCVCLNTSAVMIVCIGALSGHRASTDAHIRVVEKVDRLGARADARQAEFEQQIEVITDLLARISATVNRLSQINGEPSDLRPPRSIRRDGNDR